MRVNKLVSTVCVFAVVAGLIVACNTAPTPQAQSPTTVPTKAPSQPVAATPPTTKVDQTLVIVLEKDVATFDVHKPNADTGLASLVYDFLIKYDADGKRLPGLAESWEISEDASQLTFHLRKGVKFHDGTPFNAEAVKVNFDRQMDTATGAARTKELTAAIANITTPDEYTVVFNLKDPDVAFIGYYIGEVTNGAIMSPAAIKKYGQDLGAHPVGTGPWKFVSQSIGREIVLERNAEYWAGPPKASKLIMKIIPDAATRLVELETGNVHWIRNLDPIQIKTIESKPNLVLQSKASTSLYGLFINQKNDLLKDVKVRQALAMAVNRDEIVSALVGKAGIRSQGPVPVLNLGHNPNVKEPPYDVAGAKKLLAEAGWTAGSDGILQKGGQKLKFTIVTPGGRYIGDKEICTAVQDQLKSVGIDATVKVVEASSFWDELFAGRFDLAFTGGWFTDPDPARGPMYLYFGETQYNVFGYKNSEVLSLFAQIRKTGDFEKRKQMAWKVQEILTNDAVGIWFYNANILAATTKNLKGYVHNAIGFLRFDTAYLE